MDTGEVNELRRRWERAERELREARGEGVALGRPGDPDCAPPLPQASPREVIEAKEQEAEDARRAYEDATGGPALP